MGNAIAFDTLAYAKKMIAAGFTQKQAETQAEALAEIIDEQVVSRQYLDIRLRELEIAYPSAWRDDGCWYCNSCCIGSAALSHKNNPGI